MGKSKDRYKRRSDGLMETTRTDKRTGKRIHFYGHTNEEIDAQIMAFTSAQEKGRLFRVVAEEWNKLHFPTLAPNTLKSYKPAYQRAIDEFGETYIRQIKPKDIKRFITEFARGRKAKKTVTTQLLILSMAFSYAVEAGDIEYSPCDHISIPKSLPKTHREAASPDDEAKVKASADVWLLPYLILYTGLRKGEALALTHADLDFEHKIICITKSVYHESTTPKIKLPKTAAGIRSVPILDPLLDKLPKEGTGYIFSLDGGKTPLKHNEYNNMWSDYAAKTGITCTAHQLRHSYATMLFELDIAVKDAQDLLGHSTAAMTQDIYTHLRDTRKKSVAQSINEKLRIADQKTIETAQSTSEKTPA